MQPFTLTPDDREVVLNYAARLEKRSRHWRVLRWLAVGYFVFGIVLLVAVYGLETVMRSDFELPPEALKVSEAAGAKAMENSLQLLAAHGELQVIALRAEFHGLLRALIVAGIGTAMFLYCVSEWRRDRRDRLVARLLRTAVAMDAGDMQRENQPPYGTRSG